MSEGGVGQYSYGKSEGDSLHSYVISVSIMHSGKGIATTEIFPIFSYF